MPDRVKVEFIESFIKIGNGDYQWNDNHGELIRCRDCEYWNADGYECNAKMGYFPCSPDWYCADGERRDNDA